MKDCFIYVSQVPRTGTAGQNKFEKGVIGSLLKKEEEEGFEIKIFSASTEKEKSESKRLVLIPLNKKTYIGFIFHQLRLLISLGNYLWRQKKNKLHMFVRYHPAMFAPLLLTFLFNIRLTVRTGPVLPNLSFFNKNPGTIVYHCIKWVLGLFYKRASSIVTVTEKIKQWIVEAYKLDPEKIVIVPNAADTTLFFPEPPDRNKWKLPENDFVFGFVGVIFETQGLDTIIRALGLLKNNREKVPLLFLVGDGEYRSTLQSLSEELNIADRIIWTGNIPHEQVRSAINACDMMLAPFQKKSLELKGSSALKLWEYLACDKPILASESEDHEFLQKFNFGRMVEPDNVELWAKALSIEADKNDFVLQGRGERFTCEKHSYPSAVEKFISISLGPRMVH
ncbi:MAG: glycosyltransferase involved in cell wall biosynthesis [Nitrospinales bacterium]|jgi:glycosyltransferase involved in cell wall biosynthesis